MSGQIGRRPFSSEKSSIRHCSGLRDLKFLFLRENLNLFEAGRGGRQEVSRCHTRAESEEFVVRKCQLRKNSIGPLKPVADHGFLRRGDPKPKGGAPT